MPDPNIKLTQTLDDRDVQKNLIAQQKLIAKEIQALGKLAREGRKVGKAFDEIDRTAKKAFNDTRTPLERYPKFVSSTENSGFSKFFRARF